MNTIFLICSERIDNVMKSLEIMWKGVLAIFLTIAIIAVVSYFLNRCINKIKEARRRAAEEAALEEETSDTNTPEN